MNVIDFVMLVQCIDVKLFGVGIQLVLSIGGVVELLVYQSGNEYVVEISSWQVLVVVGVVIVGSVIQVVKVVGQCGFIGKLVIFNFQDVLVCIVLQLIVEEFNLNVVVFDLVQGNVILCLVNVLWDQVLDIVLCVKGLDKCCDGSVIWVVLQVELVKFEQEKEDVCIVIENCEDLQIDYIQINYYSVMQIFKVLIEVKGIGGSGGGGSGGGLGSFLQEDSGFLFLCGCIVVDECINMLMISDILKKIVCMCELINVIDCLVDQVLIESCIVIVIDIFVCELGVKFGVSGSCDNVYFSGNFEVNCLIWELQVKFVQDNVKVECDWIVGGCVGLLFVLVGLIIMCGLNWSLLVVVVSNLGLLVLFIFNVGYLLDVELLVMQEEFWGEVIFNLCVVIINQCEVLIKQGKEIGYVIISGGGVGGVVILNVQFKEVVLELKVILIIINDNCVFFNMQVKKDEVDQLIQLEGYGIVLLINCCEVNIVVLVEDGQIVVIGGVYEFIDCSSISKVLFLGDVLFLGNLFKKCGCSKDKVELLVFVILKVLCVVKQN